MNPTVTLNPRLTLAPRVPRVPAKYRRDSHERAYRRALRAAEMAAWHAADPKSVTQRPALYDREDHGLYLGFFVLVGATSSALVLGALATSDWMAGWETFAGFFRDVLG